MTDRKAQTETTDWLVCLDGQCEHTRATPDAVGPDVGCLRPKFEPYALHTSADIGGPALAGLRLIHRATGRDNVSHSRYHCLFSDVGPVCAH